ncbi:hypothetical protein TRIUR3_32015 [Triticum urartu]|uniref:Uncharacterized protein n=1 Tax=Triticum urartu TaxID=4572 RepID=M8AA17_TRIUA|nr:hypothetical protein TRIUR3_32015 [Triticum urartu]
MGVMWEGAEEKDWWRRLCRTGRTLAGGGRHEIVQREADGRRPMGVSVSATESSLVFARCLLLHRICTVAVQAELIRNLVVLALHGTTTLKHGEKQCHEPWYLVQAGGAA